LFKTCLQCVQSVTSGISELLPSFRAHRVLGNQQAASIRSLA